MAKRNQTVRAAGEGVVLPPGSLPTQAAPSPGDYEVRIDGIDDSGHVRCVYPGPFVKHHDARTVAELCDRVVGTLRGRYGAGEVTFVRVPTSVDPGQSFVVKG